MTSTSVNSIVTNWQQRREDQRWLPFGSTQSGGFEYPSTSVVSKKANGKAAALRLLARELSRDAIAHVKQPI